MNTGLSEFYGNPQQTNGNDFSYLEATGGVAAVNGPEQLDGGFGGSPEKTQAITLGLGAMRQAFRNGTTLRASGQDYTPTTYSYLGRLQQLAARYRQRGAEPPAETNLYSSRITPPPPVRVEDLRGWARVPVEPARILTDVPYAPGPALPGQVYRTAERARYDQQHAGPQSIEGPVVDLTLQPSQEKAAVRLIAAWEEHCNHDEDEARMERARRILIGVGALASSLVASSASAWAVYEFVLNR